MKTVAQVISRIFDPIVEVPLMISLAVWYAYVNGLGWRLLLILLFIDALLPFLFFLHLLKKQEIDDWDISRRAQRIPVYGFTMLTHLAGVGVAWLTGRTQIAQILLVFWILGMIFFAITTTWKVSVHAGVNAALVTFIVMVSGISYAWLYLLLLPVGWARVYSGKHSLGEFVVGALLATVGLWLGFQVFGFT